MKNREISRQIQRLNSLVSRTSAAAGGDLELQAEWARYICIVAAGLIENGLKAIYSDFVDNASSVQVAGFAKATLSRIQNPRAERFLEISGSFNDDWRNELERFFEKHGGKEAINSIMSNRHLIAHGKTSNISMTPLKDYIKEAVRVLELIEQQCTR
jgi:hypothetical protein